jgi:molecular chaperone DnaK (HSP70)
MFHKTKIFNKNIKMARTKIDYGIDLGTTNSAISRIENGGEAK